MLIAFTFALLQRYRIYNMAKTAKQYHLNYKSLEQFTDTFKDGMDMWKRYQDHSYEVLGLPLGERYNLSDDMDQADALWMQG